MECDVLVIGAGPAGSSAAQKCAELGLDTILVEKNFEVGLNIQCAETISNYLIPKLPFEIPRELLKWKLDGMYFWADDFELTNLDKNWCGYNISRNLFDKWISTKAVNAGAKLLLNTKLVDIIFDNNYVVEKAILKRNDKIVEVKSKFIIAADGPNSTVARRLGVYSPVKNGMGKVIAYDVSGVDLTMPHLDQIFFGDFAPGAYAYIMPKDGAIAGIGVGTSLDKNKSRLEDFFDEFCNTGVVKKQLKKMIIIDEKSGDAPVSPSVSKLVYGNVIFCGDAACQNIKPFLEGILPGIICGNLSGEYLSNCWKNKKQLSNDSLESIIDKNVPYIKESNKLTSLIQSELSNNKIHLINLGIFSGRLDPSDIKRLAKLTPEELKEVISSSKILAY